MRHQKMLLRSVGGVLALSGFLAGCGTEGVQSSPPEPTETKPAEVSSSKSAQPKVRLPKNVNPNASNRGLKGKYAD